MLRRLHAVQPASFAFTPANLAWAHGQIAKYPEGRQASAIIPLLWRAQEQEGWLSRPAIEHVSAMLGLAYIRGLEVATFYFMFQLQPVGSIAHIQICGTTSCMICGAEDLVAVCRELINPRAHALSADGKFSWEEVECLGACANAPMAQIGKDYYEDLTPQGLRDLIGRFSAGEVPVPGPQNGRYAAEPLSGLTSLTDHAAGRARHNASAQAAVDIGDTVKRIDGTEVPLLTPWIKRQDPSPQPGPTDAKAALGLPEAVGDALAMGKPETIVAAPAGIAMAAPGQPTATGMVPAEDRAADRANPKPARSSDTAMVGERPRGLTVARGGKADDLRIIWGIGPKLAALCNALGFYHFDQIAGWTDAEIAWVDENLEGFKGRVTRDKWVAQAKVLAAGGTAEDAERIGRGDI